MQLRERQKAETHAQILAAASDLFAELGYEATTTRAVAARAGVAVGTLFAHFPDKPALVSALLEERIGAAMGEALATLPPGGLVAELVHVAETLYRSYDERPDLARVLVQHALFAAGSDEQRAALEAWVTGRVREAMASGALRPVDPKLAFVHYFSCYFAILVGGLRGEIAPKARGPLLGALLDHFHGGKP